MLIVCSTRRLIVKLAFAQMRISAATLMLVIALPILASCGGSPEVSTAPTPALPTAAVGTSAPAATAAAPATSAPDATAALPEPTSGPAPTAAEPAPTSTSTPKQNLEFGIVNHLYYTDRERVLTLDGIA